MTKATTPEGNSLIYRYDGDLAIGESWAGEVTGDVDAQLNNKSAIDNSRFLLKKIRKSKAKCPTEDVERYGKLDALEKRVTQNLLTWASEQAASNYSGNGEIIAGAAREAICIALFAISAP